MNNYLTISKIPNTPTGYNEVIPISDERIFRLPEPFLIEFETGDFWKTFDEQTNERKQVIQRAVYKQYEAVIFIKENTDLNVLLTAGKIIWTDEFNLQREIILTEAPRYEKIENTYTYKATIKFREVRTDFETITNYFQKTSLNADYSWGYLEAGGTKFYTRLYPKFVNENKVLEKITTADNREYATKILNHNVLTVNIYLDESDTTTLLRKLGSSLQITKATANGSGLTTSTNGIKFVMFGGTEYLSFENVDYKADNKGLIGLYEIEIKMKTNAYIYYPQVSLTKTLQ